MTRRQKRFLEVLPGLFSWNLILFPIWGGILLPEITAYFIVAFVVYSVYRSGSLTLFAVLTHLKMRAAQSVNWLDEARGFGDWQKVKHLVIILVANEPEEVYEETVVALTKQTLPLPHIVPVMATEQRFPKGAEHCRKLKEKYGHLFGEFIISEHPADIVGEIKGKSSNENWAAREAKKYLVDEKGWDIDYLTVTSNDSDAIVDRQYFACLTFKFMDHPKRYFMFWQPCILFYKNIWKLPVLTRVINRLAGIINLGELSRNDKLVSFSNYSLSLKMADTIGYWDTDVIPEDYRIFFKAFFALDGKVEVEPIFLPTNADAPESTTTWKTFVNDYQQKKRWAWGVSDFPVFLQMFWRSGSGSLFTKLIRIFHVMEQHFLWPVNWFMITVGATVVTLVNPNFSRTTIGVVLPQVTSGLMSVTVVFLIVLLYVESIYQKELTGKVSRLRRLLSPLEFLLMPIASLFFGALPGLDAHTRLMLGKYLEYRITEKVKTQE